MNKFNIFSIILIITILSMFLYLNMGNFSIPYSKTLEILKDSIIRDNIHSYSNSEKMVILDIRLPRLLMVMVVGASLSVSGAACQGIFRNPLVSPFILGISSAAAFGASLGIIFFNSSQLSIEILSLIFGYLASLIVFFMAKDKFGNSPIITLVLSGIIISSLFTSLVGIMKYIADTDTQLPAITFWMMGGFSNITWSDIFPNVPIILSILFIIWRFSWNINILSLGEKEATSLGLNSELTKFILIFLVAGAMSFSISKCGVIGWVGLVVPHIARFLVGPEHRKLIPASAILGSLFLIIADLIARTITVGEIPIGIITSLIGAPFLIILMKKGGNSGWS